jgi:nitroreductase
MNSAMPILNQRSAGTVDLLLSRRSGTAKSMTEPGPSPAQIEVLLTAAARVPDHGKLFPWRFIIFEGEGRRRMGTVLAECLIASEAQASPDRIEQERCRFLRAPLVVGVVSRVRESIPIPEWQQILSAGAVCQTLLIASHAMGFVANWITESCAYHPTVRDRLGMKSGERIAGFVYIGTSAVPLEERVRPELTKIVTRF